MFNFLKVIFCALLMGNCGCLTLIGALGHRKKKIVKRQEHTPTPSSSEEAVHTQIIEETLKYEKPKLSNWVWGRGVELFMEREGAVRFLTVWVRLEHQYLDPRGVSFYNPVAREEICPMQGFLSKQKILSSSPGLGLTFYNVSYMGHLPHIVWAHSVSRVGPPFPSRTPHKQVR